MLHDLNITGSEPEEQIRKSLAQIQEQEKIELDELQIQAVIEAVNCGLLIITGGPGTGKTTTINTISGTLRWEIWRFFWLRRRAGRLSV